MDNNTTTNFTSLSTYDLAFNLALNRYNGDEKLRALDVIKSREPGAAVRTIEKEIKPVLPPANPKTKAFKIYQLLKDGKTPMQVELELKKMRPSIKAYAAEIYRVKNKYKL